MVHICMCAPLYYLSVCMCVPVHKCVSIYLCLCMYVCVYVSVYCMYMCVCLSVCLSVCHCIFQTLHTLPTLLAATVQSRRATVTGCWQWTTWLQGDGTCKYHFIIIITSSLHICNQCQHTTTLDSFDLRILRLQVIFRMQYVLCLPCLQTLLGIQPNFRDIYV